MWKWLTSRWKRHAPEPLSSWFLVRWDDTAVHVDVRPPGGDAGDVVQLQWVPGYAIPMDAAGGHELWDELLRRGLFDPELASRAMTAVDGVFCWPELEADGEGQRPPLSGAAR